MRTTQKEDGRCETADEEKGRNTTIEKPKRRKGKKGFARVRTAQQTPGAEGAVCVLGWRVVVLVWQRETA